MTCTRRNCRGLGLHKLYSGDVSATRISATQIHKATKCISNYRNSVVLIQSSRVLEEGVQRRRLRHVWLTGVQKQRVLAYLIRPRGALCHTASCHITINAALTGLVGHRSSSLAARLRDDEGPRARLCEPQMEPSCTSPVLERQQPCITVALPPLQLCRQASCSEWVHIHFIDFNPFA